MVSPKYGYVYGRELNDGRLVGVLPMTFGKFRMQLLAGFEVLDGW